MDLVLRSRWVVFNGEQLRELSVYNLGSRNSAAFSTGEQGERERETVGLLQSLVFMAQPEIAALKQAIISLPLHLSLPLSPTLLRYEMSPLSPPPPLPLVPLCVAFLPIILLLLLSSPFLLPRSLHPLSPRTPWLSLSLSVLFSLVGAIEKIICCCCVLFDRGFLPARLGSAISLCGLKKKGCAVNNRDMHSEGSLRGARSRLSNRINGVCDFLCYILKVSNVAKVLLWFSSTCPYYVVTLSHRLHCLFLPPCILLISLQGTQHCREEKRNSPFSF